MGNLTGPVGPCGRARGLMLANTALLMQFPRARKFTCRTLVVALAALAATCGDSATAPEPAPQPNRVPVVSGSIPAQSMAVGESVTVNVAAAFSDPDGDALTFSVNSSNTAVAGVSASGTNVTITGVGAGTATVTVTARDPGGFSAVAYANVTVAEPNRAPVVSGSIPAQSMAVGESVTVNVAAAFSDPDGNPLAFSATSSTPAVVAVAVSGANMTLTGVSTGTSAITVTATDPDGLSASLNVVVTVTQPNRAPTVAGSIPAQTLSVGETASVDAALYFSDPDGDALTFSATSAAQDVATVAVTDANVTIAGVSAGTADITVTATDPGGLSASLGVGVSVTLSDDHGDSIATATAVAIGDTVQGYLTAGDEDFFRITIPRDDFPLIAFTEGTTDTYGHLLDGNGTAITSNDDSGERLNFRIARELDAGTYYLRIRGVFLRPTGPYTLVVVEEDQTDYFDLADANTAPGGITYASGRFYVTDWLGDKVYAYTASGARASDHDFDLIVTGIADAITYANDHFYVLYWDRHKVYAYTASGARASDHDFDLDDDNRESSSGMTYANGRFYVTDYLDDKVYAYDASGARAAAFDFDLATHPSGGIRYARDRFYVANSLAKKVYAYDASGARAADYDFDLDDDNDDANGMTYANDRFYVINSGPDSFGPDDKVYAYDAAGHASMIANGFGKPSEGVVGGRVESGWLQALKQRTAEADRERKVEERRAAGSLEGRLGR